MRQLSKDGPEDVKAFFLTYKPDTLKALLVSTDLAAEERICALITEKRPYSATAKTPATKAGARTKKKVPTGELTKA